MEHSKSMILMIANKRIDSSMHRKIKRQDTTNLFPSHIQVFMHIRVRHPSSGIKVLKP